tara:strand:- start:477 stop:722 length:246 start_codon:yes stop_codon:yes gene_type:complete
MVYSICIVHFKDIVGDSTWDGVDEINTIEAKNIGWLVHEDVNTVKVASTLDEDGTPSGITAFPRGTITRIENLCCHEVVTE